MGTLTIHNLDDKIKSQLRLRAAQQGCSMEEEARVILRQAVGSASGASLWALSRKLFAEDDGVNLPLPERSADRNVPNWLDEQAKK